MLFISNAFWVLAKDNLREDVGYRREVTAEMGLGFEISAQKLVEKNGLDIGFEGLKIEKMRF
jgi:hypothetical protein